MKAIAFIVPLCLLLASCSDDEQAALRLTDHDLGTQSDSGELSADGAQSEGDSGAAEGAAEGVAEGGSSGELSADPPLCSDAALPGHAFARASGAQSDPDYPPALAIDGCSEAASRWTGDTGESLQLALDSAQPVQGLYLWLAGERTDWIKVEQSVDGAQWQSRWERLPLRGADGLHYLSLDTDALIGHLRLSVYGSAQNAWTGIREARWSLSGDALSGRRAWRHSEQILATHGGAERALSEQYLRHLNTLFLTCPYTPAPVFVDATGALDHFWRYDEIADTPVYRVDWAHYPLPPSSDTLGAPNLTYEPMEHALERLEPLAEADPDNIIFTNCRSDTVKDALHTTDEQLREAREGLLSPGHWE